MTAMKTWTVWPWTTNPTLPLAWLNPERPLDGADGNQGRDRVVIVEGLLAISAAEGERRSANTIIREHIREATVVYVETEKSLRTIDVGRPPFSLGIPALRVERQADVTAQALRTLGAVDAEHRALFICPREEVDLSPLFCDGCEQTEAELEADGGIDSAGDGTPYCVECEREMGVWSTLNDDDSPDLVIVAGDVGPSAQPMPSFAVRSIRGQCEADAVAFSFLGWGRWVPTSSSPHGVATMEVDGALFADVGPEGDGAGTIDGQAHAELPEDAG